MKKDDPFLVEDDGLICPEVGSWAPDKYRLISNYAKIFSTAMKHKWGRRVYIDLYAGAGFSRIKGTDTRLKGSPLLALTVDDPFDEYIFCEGDPNRLKALKARGGRIAPNAAKFYIAGNCDEKINEICTAIPKPSQTNTVLSLCLVDPFDFGIKFETLRRLSSDRLVDFLVLLAIGMDANRNYDNYVEGDSTKIDDALGNTEWRDRWKTIPHKDEFRRFLAAEFSASMESLGYLHQSLDQMKLVRSTEKNLPLYYLTLFSKHRIAYKLWEQALKYGTDQTSFNFTES